MEITRESSDKQHSQTASAATGGAPEDPVDNKLAILWTLYGDNTGGAPEHPVDNKLATLGEQARRLRLDVQ